MSALALRPLCHQELDSINAVISEAMMAWTLPERMKRLSLPLVRYDAVDLDHFDAIGARVSDQSADELLGVALWDNELLHGLYVRPQAQGSGIGRALLDAVRIRARRAGVQRLLVKAERVSASYFRQQGLAAAGPESPYPYAFYLPTVAPVPDQASRQLPDTALSLR